MIPQYLKKYKSESKRSNQPHLMFKARKPFTKRVGIFNKSYCTRCEPYRAINDTYRSRNKQYRSQIEPYRESSETYRKKAYWTEVCKLVQ